MCGFSGIFAGNDVKIPLSDVARKMAETLRHRGPDDAGVWMDKDAGLALAHRRLAILDLSSAGHQPMVSASGRYAIAFNGEIYNHLLLRAELEKAGAAPAWRGHSDTETMLAAFETWGVEQALQKFTGMFAFALWDRQERHLTLARDRLGEKPLYYGCVNHCLLFASELKAIRQAPEFDNAIDRRALTLFMRHSYIPAPWSIYQGIWKLPPGCYVQFTSAAVARISPSERGNIRCYWSARAVAEAGLAQPFAGSEEEAVAELERLLRQSISCQMLSDVPLGALLSGGIDSSTVAALMQAQSAQPIKTFTIGFFEREYNEAEHAKCVAEHLGTEHTELYVKPQEAQEVIPRLPDIYDEPFADSSQVPTFLVMQLARRSVTVALSGDGGDEVFGGYNRYFWAASYWRYLSAIPGPLQHLMARLITAVSPRTWNRFFSSIAPILPKWLRYNNPGDKLHKFTVLFGAKNPECLYLFLLTHWDDPSRLVLGGEEPPTPITDAAAWLNCDDFERRMMYLDTITYLPDDILAKVDRAAMSVSLETRAPYLDHRVIEFAWRLPLAMKIWRGKGKMILRRLLNKYVPVSLMERAKMGFGLPIDHWLRGPLRDWADTLLAEQRLRQGGFFDPKPIREKWAEHLAGQRNWQYLLWAVLMFEAWRENNSTRSK